MFVDYHCFILRNVTGYLLSSFLIDETAESSYVDILPLGQRVFHHREKGLQCVCHFNLINSGLIGDLCNYVCFRHDFLNFNVYCVVEKNSGVKNETAKVDLSTLFKK